MAERKSEKRCKFGLNNKQNIGRTLLSSFFAKKNSAFICLFFINDPNRSGIKANNYLHLTFSYFFTVQFDSIFFSNFLF